MYKDLLSTIRTASWRGLFVATLNGVAIFFTGQYGTVFAIVLALSAVGKDSAEVSRIFASDQYVANLIALTMISAALIGLVFWSLKLYREKKPFDFLMMQKKLPTFRNLGGVLATYGWYFLLLVAVTALLGSFTAVDVNQSQELGIAMPKDAFDQVLIFVTIVILPAVTEEILFRGFLYGKLRQAAGKYIAGFVTCVLFGLAHLEYGNLNWIAVADTLILSGFLIYISQKHKSLYSAMLLHALKNSIAFYVLFVG